MSDDNTQDAAEPSPASAGSPFLLGFVIALSGFCGYLRNRISVVSDRVDMAIMVQQAANDQLHSQTEALIQHETRIDQLWEKVTGKPLFKK
jgi:hypothetical protein